MTRFRRWCSTTAVDLAELAGDSADLLAWAVAYALAGWAS